MIFLHGNAIVLIPYLVFVSQFALVSNILPELCELETKVNWFLMKPPHPGRPMFILWLQLPLTQLLWPLCKLHPSCSNRPTGVLICLGSNVTRSVIFMIWQFCVKKYIFLHQLPATPYCPRTFGLQWLRKQKKKCIISWLRFSASFIIGKMIIKDQPFN